MGASSWLIRDDMDRERMLDMEQRLRPARRAAFGVLALALIASGPWLGWWTLIPLTVAGVFFSLADRLLDRWSRPEYALFAAWAASQVIIGVSAALTGGPKAATVAWLGIPVATLSARFSGRGTLVGVALTLVLLVAVCFGVDAHAVLADPPLLLAPAALILAVAIFSTVLMRSDIEHRSEAVLDPLTQVLNRKALEFRVEELTQQAAVTGDPVGLIVGDLDRFKAVNDSRGHAVGDAVLKDVAYVLRKQLRAFDLVYRIGGEEFLVLLPGAAPEGAAEVAERLRTAVCADSVGGGERVTMSFGVAASAAGGAFDYEAVFAAADAALYEAKRAGRDRVCGHVEAALA